ncbi:MAG: hypothetical protein RMZ41_001090 [Nostoc sp. DedVER02]|uniref:hypothetical protein n=1 Tax=unclassified Nostoc TaxID=2593658 RepID=UPI002AD402AD|nr:MULTISPECIES: hypothetical protein [unclassified Nostoc]MDZ7987606.1 hypothetical protein [Nostoc sp. DedVER02]MDZ8112946.1 hypothetical protein [Nostoc sp. DedVER01b]
MDVFAQLREFRQAAYQSLCRAKDATFEMMDAILLTRNAYSLADLSMCPVFRRQWSSIYETTQDTRPQRNKLMGLYSQKIPKQGRIILAGDHTVWSRPDAPTLKERTYEHQTIELEDAKLGRVKICLWTRKHFRLSPHHTMSIILVERLQEDGSPRVNKPMWLAFVGEEMPPLSEVWKLYMRRFAVDHWYRFIKQRLHWTLPKLSTPQQCDRWSDLMPLMTWELWLARDIVNDNPLPWQKQITKLTPGRVAQAIPGILVRVSTPSIPPKPRGKSPGWKAGQPRQRRIRYPIVKKRTSSSRKAEPKPA